jgi:hypothetical protein
VRKRGKDLISFPSSALLKEKLEVLNFEEIRERLDKFLVNVYNFFSNRKKLTRALWV